MATKKAAAATKKSAAQKKSVTKATTPHTSTVSTVATTSKRRFVVSKVSAGAVVAEFIGTFILAMAIIASQGSPVIVGFALIALVLAVGTLSNAYFNPALSLAAWLTRRISGARAAAYVIAEALGAMFALVVLSWFAHANGALATTNAAGQNTGALQLFTANPITAGKEWYIFAAELLGTFILGLAVASVVRAKERGVVAFTVGFGIFVSLLIASSAAGVVQGTSILNPAVAISLQALSFKVWPLAIYILGPVLGAVAGFVLFDLLKNNEDTTV